MRKVYILITCIGLIIPLQSHAQEVRQWTLRECIDHALAHHIGLKKERASLETANVNIKEAKAGWQPSLHANISQGLTYRPFQENGGNLVNGGIAASASDKAIQNGSYGINAAWTIWDGQKRTLNIKDSQLQKTVTEYAIETAENSIQESIAQLYIQILYTKEALKVNEALLHQDSVVYERGKEMFKQGQMSRADLAQLEAQLASGKYDIINTQTQVENYKLQLKQLLELAPTQDLDVADTHIEDASVVALIDDKMGIYQAALNVRPEIKSSETAIERSIVATKLAKASYMPTISLTGSIGDSHITGSNNSFFDQIKNNFNTNIGVGISIPILDNRKTKSAVQRARVNEFVSQLDLQERQKQLYSTIESYWLNATNNRQKFIAARSNVESLQTSYDLIQEQFRLGLKNIVELMDSRSKLLTAKQDLLQNKYTTILNKTLLEFYAGKTISL